VTITDFTCNRWVTHSIETFRQLSGQLIARECHYPTLEGRLISLLSRLRGRAVRLTSHDSKESGAFCFARCECKGDFTTVQHTGQLWPAIQSAYQSCCHLHRFQPGEQFRMTNHRQGPERAMGRHLPRCLWFRVSLFQIPADSVVVNRSKTSTADLRAMKLALMCLFNHAKVYKAVQATAFPELRNWSTFNILRPPALQASNKPTRIACARFNRLPTISDPRRRSAHSLDGKQSQVVQWWAVDKAAQIAQASGD
jgi:hypothetical protein